MDNKSARLSLMVASLLLQVILIIFKVKWSRSLTDMFFMEKELPLFWSELCKKSELLNAAGRLNNIAL